MRRSSKLILYVVIETREVIQSQSQSTRPVHGDGKRAVLCGILLIARDMTASDEFLINIAVS